jgi:hypothetical protein
MSGGTAGHRILGAWLAIALVGLAGWATGTVHVSRYVDGLDRDAVCANTGVALRDTTLIGAERARRDSSALAERNCSARYRVARQGRQSRVFIPLALVVLVSGLVASFFSVRWLLRRAGRPHA